MNTLVCPISKEKVSRTAVRLTGLMMAGMIALYIVTGNILFIFAVLVDYSIRAFSPLPYSPFSWAASQVERRMNLSSGYIDKAPKIFAARVGWLFAMATAVLAFVSPFAAMAIGSTLMGFALLESVFDFCVGCLVYTYVVLPFARK